MEDFYYRRIPAQLRRMRSWLLWKTVQRKGGPTKEPFMPDGRHAKSNDPKTWSSFIDVLDKVRQFDGLGFVFSDADPYCGLDLDGCRDPKTGVISEWAMRILEQFNTYGEISPSGTGVKLFMIGRSPWGKGKCIKLDIPSPSGKQCAIEVYDSKRYFAVTGICPKNRANVLTDCQGELNALKDRFQPKTSPKPQEGKPAPTGTPVERARRYIRRCNPAISGQSGHNQTFAVACKLVLGFGLSPDQAMDLMLSDYNDRCQPPWSLWELRHKVEDADSQPGPRGVMLG